MERRMSILFKVHTQAEVRHCHLFHDTMRVYEIVTQTWLYKYTLCILTDGLENHPKP